MNKLELKVREFIEDENLIYKNEKVIVAFSGGPDSLCLLDILNKYKKAKNFKLYAAHLNHRLRGIDAYKDAIFCTNYCEKNNIPFFSKSLDINKLSRERKKSIEETARECRYEMLNEVKNTINADKIAVAHNMDDQVETFFLNLFRGSGIDGLKGMRIINKDIIRPLLCIKRTEILEYCEENELNPVIDKSNEEDIYSRNKIRINLIPYIENEFNTNIKDTVFRNTSLLGKDSEFLDELANIEYQKNFNFKDNDAIVSNIENLKKYDFSVLSRMIRIAIENLLGNLKGIEYIHIYDVISLIFNKDKHKKLNLPRDINIVKNDFLFTISIGEILFKEIAYNYKLNINSSIYVDELGLKVMAKVLPKEDCIKLPTGKNIKAFDYKKINGDIYIRNRMDGDKIRPIGLKGTKKISDILIEKKIELYKKNYYPIFSDNSGILWMWDYRISEDYKIDDSTTDVLRISLKFD